MYMGNYFFKNFLTMFFNMYWEKLKHETDNMQKIKSVFIFFKEPATIALKNS